MLRLTADELHYCNDLPQQVVFSGFKEKQSARIATRVLLLREDSAFKLESQIA